MKSLCFCGITLLCFLTSVVETADGDLDPTFGATGKVTTDFFGGDDDVFAVAIQPGGKIVVAGFAQVSSDDSAFALARYNRDGSLDTDFGDGGKVTTDFFDFGDAAIDIALQPDGKIVAAGGTRFDFALARYNRNGSLDTDFGDGGKVTTDFFAGVDQAQAVALEPGGKIVVAGFAEVSNEDFAFALARYNRDGSLDTNFGDGGKVTTDFFGDVDNVTAVALQPGGKIVAAGGAFNISRGNDFALARYNRDGSLDTDFGDGGRVTTDFFGFTDRANAVAIQPGGKIVAAGAAGDSGSGVLDFALARYNRDGSLDTDFGGGGKVTTEFFGGFDEATAVAIQPGGRIVAAGFTEVSSGDFDFALARYLFEKPKH